MCRGAVRAIAEVVGFEAHHVAVRPAVAQAAVETGGRRRGVVRAGEDTVQPVSAADDEIGLVMIVVAADG